VVTPVVTPVVTTTPTPTPPRPPTIWIGGGTYSRPTSKKLKIPKKIKKKKKGYYVITKKFKKPVIITQMPLSKGEALAFGLKYTKKTERATFKLVETKKDPVSIGLHPITEREVYQAGYRPPVRKGRYQTEKITTFIQRSKTRMGTKKETKAIQKYKGNPYWNPGGKTRAKRKKIW